MANKMDDNNRKIQNDVNFTKCLPEKSIHNTIDFKEINGGSTNCDMLCDEDSDINSEKVKSKNGITDRNSEGSTESGDFNHEKLNGYTNSLCHENFDISLGKTDLSYKKTSTNTAKTSSNDQNEPSTQQNQAPKSPVLNKNSFNTDQNGPSSPNQGNSKEIPSPTSLESSSKDHKAPSIDETQSNVSIAQIESSTDPISTISSSNLVHITSPKNSQNKTTLNGSQTSLNLFEQKQNSGSNSSLNKVPRSSSSHSLNKTIEKETSSLNIIPNPLEGTTFEDDCCNEEEALLPAKDKNGMPEIRGSPKKNQDTELLLGQEEDTFEKCCTPKCFGEDSVKFEDERLQRGSNMVSSEVPKSNSLDNCAVLTIDDSRCIQNGSISNKTEKTDDKKSQKSDSEPERPVLHVQFGKSHSQSTVPIKDQISTPSESLSSSSSSSSDDDASSIGLSEARAPDGGWGWVVVAASFMVNLIADGITFSFGVMYVEFLNYFGEGKSKTAWIGSLFMAMPLLSGPVASFLTDRYGCRKVTIVGSILAATGFVTSTFSNNMEVLFFTFGIVAGFGLSLCYVAAVVIVAYYFDKKRSFATGLSVCGSGIGTFIFAPLIQALLAEYGWRGTTLILAGFFLNLAVCGALMRDLPWTSTKNKKVAEEKKRIRHNKRHNKKNGSSVDTFSVSNSTYTTSNIQSNVDKISEELKQLNDNRLFCSLVNLPTYVRNGEKVPIEVLELLSTNKNVYNVLFHNYPGLLTSSRSFSDSGRLNDSHHFERKLFAPVTSPLTSEPIANKPITSPVTENFLWWLRKHNSAIGPHHKHKLPAYLRDLRVHRSSLTYRGAMLNINRYRLRASSCPDIYRNSMTTIAKEKSQWYAGLWEFWDLLVDMLDFSHFSDPRFLLFALSNFLLYTWYDVPYVYLTDNAVEMGFSETQSSYLIAIVGIVNMAGEILLGWAGDKTWVNPGLVYAVCMGLCGAITALVPLIKSYSWLCVVAGGFGFFIAANYSLTSIILVELITLEKFTNAYGLLLLVQGIANLVGPPLAGWLYDITGKYDLPFYLAGFFIAVSGVLLVILPATNRYKYFQSLQRQASVSESSVGVECSSVKEPQFHSILASCITGSIEKEKKEINHV